MVFMVLVGGELEAAAVWRMTFSDPVASAGNVSPVAAGVFPLVAWQNLVADVE
jgi:hypothetical protein